MFASILFALLLIAFINKLIYYNVNFNAVVYCVYHTIIY